MVCRTCGKTFVVKRVRRGYKNQCDSCSRFEENEPRRFLGRVCQSDKGGNITVFRSNLEFVARQLKCEAARGWSPNLMLGTPMISQAEAAELGSAAKAKAFDPKPPNFKK